MRIASFYAQDIGPLSMADHALFRADFSLFGKPEERILLMGRSGSGKTTVLRTMGMLWACLGALLYEKKPDLPDGYGSAMHVQGLGGIDDLLVCVGQRDFLDRIGKAHPNALMAGYRVEGGRAFPVFPGNDAQRALKALGEGWRHFRKDMPNLVLLDPECPKSLGEGLPEGFLFCDAPDLQRVLQNPQRALESLDEKETARDVIEGLNLLLVGKQVEAGGLLVRLARGGSHPLSGLSRGEREALALLYIVSTHLGEGGVLLLDHPDNHIHPEQVSGLLSALEIVMRRRGGQMILTSHRSEVWERYERIGLTIRMEAVL